MSESSKYSSESTESKLPEEVKQSPKLARPRSLSIQLSFEEPDGKQEQNSNDVISEVHAETKKTEEIDNDYKTDNVEVEINNTAVTIHEHLPDNAQNIGRKTPHLTEQGFFDLKFYHNKLW